MSTTFVKNVHIVHSFDWTPEQWVPNMTSSHHLADEDPCPLSWPSEHRLFPLQPPPVGTRPALVLRLEAESVAASDPSQHKGNQPLLYDYRPISFISTNKNLFLFY